MTPAAPALMKGPWRSAGPVFLMLVVWIGLLYRGTVEAMVLIWLRSETFNHCFVVLPIAIWLVWRQRYALSAQVPSPSAWGLLLLAGAALAWLLGDLVAINALTQFALMAMLVLLVPAFVGWDVARIIAFPLAFMFFAVPFGEFITPMFMVWTADFTVQALRWTGIPVHREGLQFIIPSGNWSVVEACSGVRYLIASVTVGTLFAYLNYRSLRRRAIFILVSFLVPVVANWVRAYAIVMLGHFSGNTLATGVDHLVYGWVFFGVVILIMFFIGAKWAEPEVPSAVAAHYAPSFRDATRSRLGLGFFAVFIALAVAMPPAARWAIDRADVAAAPSLGIPPALDSGWGLSQEAIAHWKPAFQNPSAEVNGTYRNGPLVAGLYLGYYRSQGYDRKLVSSGNVLVNSGDASWAQVSAATRQAGFGDKSVMLRTAELRGLAALGADGERLTVWRIYWINGTLTASDAMAKVYGAWYRLLGRGDDSAVIIMYAPKGSAGEGEASLAAFAKANGAAIEALLQQTRERR